jgi:hypothetical protein
MYALLVFPALIASHLVLAPLCYSSHRAILPATQFQIEHEVLLDQMYKIMKEYQEEAGQRTLTAEERQTQQIEINKLFYNAEQQCKLFDAAGMLLMSSHGVKFVDCCCLRLRVHWWWWDVYVYVYVYVCVNA